MKRLCPPLVGRFAGLVARLALVTVGANCGGRTGLAWEGEPGLAGPSQADGDTNAQDASLSDRSADRAVDVSPAEHPEEASAPTPDAPWDASEESTATHDAFADDTAANPIDADPPPDDVSDPEPDDASNGPPSCRNLAPTCSVTATEDCCASLLIPGGTICRGNNIDIADCVPPENATVSDYRLDKFEVTVARFRAYAAHYRGPPAPNAGAHARIADSGWDPAWDANLATDRATLLSERACTDPFGKLATWTPASGPHESMPMNCVSFYEAFAFCAWDGGYLPTFAEWDYAASGGSEHRIYPWSVPPSAQIIDKTYAVYDCFGCSFQDAIFPVGSRSPKGDGRWGHADLGGSVEEWTLDYLLFPSPCVDCAAVTYSPALSHARYILGGNWLSTPALVGNPGQLGQQPDAKWSTEGFRCARSP